MKEREIMKQRVDDITGWIQKQELTHKLQRFQIKKESEAKL